MLERVCWIVLALIHLSPFTAFFLPAIISRLYAVTEVDPNFAILHHRAAMFGVIFIACIWATFDPNVRKLAVVIAALSMLSFIAIYVGYGQPATLTTIAIVDAIGLPFLVYAGWKAFTA
ncbi:MAG: hypothetical protein Pars2KO_21190 [Parasphingorhabdus sp.]